MRKQILNVFKKKHIKMTEAKKTKKVYNVVAVFDDKGKKIDYQSTSDYNNSVPSGAARKAFSAVCRNKNIKGECGMKVEVALKSNPGKVYSYSVYRSKLSEPKVLAGREINFDVACKSNKNGDVLSAMMGKPATKAKRAKKAAKK